MSKSASGYATEGRTDWPEIKVADRQARIDEFKAKGDEFISMLQTFYASERSAHANRKVHLAQDSMESAVMWITAHIMEQPL